MEERIVFSLGDIAGIRLQCRNSKCRGEIILPIGKFHSNTCLHCFQSWVPTTRNDDWLGLLLSSIQMITESPDQYPNVKMELTK